MKIMVISDLHYEKRIFRGVDESEAWDWLMSVVELHEPDLLLSCGDWGSAVTLEEFYNLLEKTVVLTIYGNHENMSVLKCLHNIRGSLPVLLRDGEIHEIGSLRIVGINGIVSIRRRSRRGVPRKRPEEFLSVAESLKGKDVDILLMHEVPFLPQLYPYQRKSEGSIVALKAVEIIRPKLVLNGHMHGCCYTYCEFPWGSKYLRVESSMHEKCYAILDVNELKVNVFKDRELISCFKI
jgi:predicted phosphodiesterase